MRNRASEAVRKLLALVPDTARVIRDRREAEVAFSEVQVGEVVRVRSDDRMHLDAQVISGTSVVGESMMIGETWAVFAALAALVMGYTGALGMPTPSAMMRGGVGWGDGRRAGHLMRSGEAFQVFGNDRHRGARQDRHPRRRPPRRSRPLPGAGCGQNLTIAISFNGIGVPLAVTSLVQFVWAMLAKVSSGVVGALQLLRRTAHQQSSLAGDITASSLARRP